MILLAQRGSVSETGGHIVSRGGGALPICPPSLATEP